MIKKYLIVALCVTSLYSCNFLEYDESTGITQDESYSYFENITPLVSAVYSGLQSDLGTIGGALHESATDNAVYTWPSNDVYDIYTDKWSPINTVDDKWEVLYKYIRRANSFLENYSEAELDRFEWDLTYEESLKKTRMYRHEVRVLRAYFHFELAKRYGDVPLINRTYTQQEINSIQKSSFEDVIKFISDEIDAVLAEENSLPISHKDFYQETGRITKGAALAIKARALLYAASSLHNPSGDKALWKKAAEASKAVIDLGAYELVAIASDPLYLPAGDNDVLTSKQLILERREGSASNTYEGRNLPIGFEGGNSGNTPTQNLVDAFEFKDGTVVDWSTGNKTGEIYKNRDPRFELNILYNGRNYMGQIIQTYETGANGAPIEGATLTGYYLKKLMNEKVTFNPTTPQKRRHHYPAYRYAEVLLNYAEAMTEWMGADDVTLTLTAREALNQVRTAADMPPVLVSGTEFMERLRNERRVELAFEDHRFWDIRRWKEGELVEEIFGVKITDYGATLVRVKIQDRVWNNKMYLYPIPQTERYNNSNLGQNTGW